ncbi:MAG TPA: hypothetical protein VHY84_24040 [Bryobacteraceae bacterium]|jgi:hypothetical protein|nr:hypothetical protein [Bryobacteraceae bacterium]
MTLRRQPPVHLEVTVTIFDQSADGLLVMNVRLRGVPREQGAPKPEACPEMQGDVSARE